MVNTYMNYNKRQVKNNAGGDTVYQVEDMDRLERFLILGTVGGTFYVNERDLTKENLGEVERIINEKGKAAVDKILEIGRSNRAPKHDPALVAFAIACSVENPETRSYALSHINEIVRTGTHLFHFVAYVDQRRGWGRALRKAIASWYVEKDEKSLAYQLMKYKQRDGWSHRDVLRLAHPQANTPSQNGLFKFVTSGTLEAQDVESHRFVEAALEATQSEDINRVIELVQEFNLPMEVVNTKFKSDPRMWEALAPKMGMTALLRNLRNMHKNGYLVQGSDAVRVVRERLTDVEGLKRARIHPAHVFMAQKNATDVPTPIKTALEDAFFASFGNVEPTNKRIMLALDVSGSMGSFGYGWNNNGNAVATPREWSALQAMVTARTEPYAEFYAFSTNFVQLDITARDSMKDVIRKISGIPFGGTDCSLPMFVARQQDMKFDAFCVYTDNETWSGGNTGYGYYGRQSVTSGDPMKELRDYRRKSGIHDAKLVVTAIASTGFTIADPNDFNTLDVVGFDANAPAILADFIRK